MKLSDFFPEMEGFTPVEPGVAKTPQFPNLETQVSPYLRATLPLPLQYSGDTIKQYNRPGLSSFRISPLPPGGIPSINSTAHGVTTVVNNSTNGSGILLETDGVPNSNQKVADFIPGKNITIVSDPNGGITIAADVINKIGFHDHFTFGNVTDLTSAYIGELGWSAQDGPTSGLNKSLCMGGFPNLGQVQLFQNSTSANSGGAMVPSSTWGSNRSNPGDSNSVMSSRWPLLDFPGWTAKWVFRLVRPNIKFAEQNPVAFDTTKLSLYVGFANGANATPPIKFSQRPNVFYGVRFDTDTTSPSIGDTTFHLEACQNSLNSQVVTRFNNVGTNGGNFDTGITPTEDVFYTLTMSYAASNTLVMSFTDGTTTASTTFTLTP